MIRWAIAAVLLLAGQALAAKTEKLMDWKGQYGGPAEPGAEIVSDAEAWKRLWLKIGQEPPLARMGWLSRHSRMAALGACSSRAS